MKTASEIEDWIYSNLVKSPVKTLLKGSIYREGTRPVNSKKEDAVIAVVAGLDGQYSTGVVHINVFVDYIDFGADELGKNVKRCKVIEKALLDFRLNLPIGEYWVNPNSQETVKTYNLDEQKLSYVHCKINYRLSTI